MQARRWRADPERKMREVPAPRPGDNTSSPSSVARGPELLTALKCLGCAALPEVLSSAGIWRQSCRCWGGSAVHQAPTDCACFNCCSLTLPLAALELHTHHSSTTKQGAAQTKRAPLQTRTVNSSSHRRTMPCPTNQPCQGWCPRNPNPCAMPASWGVPIGPRCQCSTGARTEYRQQPSAQYQVALWPFIRRTRRTPQERLTGRLAHLQTLCSR